MVAHHFSQFVFTLGQGFFSTRVASRPRLLYTLSSHGLHIVYMCSTLLVPRFTFQNESQWDTWHVTHYYATCRGQVCLGILVHHVRPRPAQAVLILMWLCCSEWACVFQVRVRLSSLSDQRVTDNSSPHIAGRREPTAKN